MKFIRSIKYKIILVCFVISFILVNFFSFFILNNTKEAYWNQQSVSLSSKLNTVTNSIDQDYFQILRLSTSLSNDKTITEFLISGYESPIEQNQLMVSVHNKSTQLLINLGIYDLFAKGILYSTMNNSIINFGYTYGSSSDFDTFHNICHDVNTKFASGIIENPFDYGTGGYLIPFILPIYSYQSVHEAGHLYVALNSKIITKHFSPADIAANGEVYIIIDDYMYIYDGISIKNCSHLKSAIDLADITYINARTYRTNKISQMNNKEYIMVQSNATRWIIMQNIPQLYLASSFKLKAATIVTYILLIILTTILVYFVLDRLINIPVQAIVKQLNAIAKGDFTTYNSIQRGDEFGIISSEINNMCKSIKELMDTTLENEKQKNAYEFRILQSQINPHFLYNTLNSIRWMGQINGISGITEITTSLASMLRLTAKIQSKFVTLNTEFSFINDYITIEYHRYGNVFSLEYDLESKELRNAKIIKFTLQPLIENAIFHGIEPKGTHGNIIIRVFTKDNDLFLQVRDDGVGIPEDKLAVINQFKAYKTDKDIGLSNIHQRLVLEYGPQYGITVESKLSEYTIVTIHTPLEYMEDHSIYPITLSETGDPKKK